MSFETKVLLGVLAALAVVVFAADQAARTR